MYLQRISLMNSNSCASKSIVTIDFPLQVLGNPWHFKQNETEQNKNPACHYPSNIHQVLLIIYFSVSTFNFLQSRADTSRIISPNFVHNPIVSPTSI